MNVKALIKILVVLLVFIIIEFFRLGYMRKDNAREVENQSKFYNMEQRIEVLENRIDDLETEISALQQ